MSDQTASGAHTANGGRSGTKAVVASLVGTSLEWYDFFLYITAATLVFDQLFFPEFDPTTGLLLSFATASVGFVARPVGGIISGHFGDKVGRKNVLVITLLIMGISTFLIGLLPTYGSIGVAAPVLLVTLRFLQGLGLGGEWGGAVLMSMEHGSPKRRGFNASWPQVGVPVGNLLSAGMIAILSVVMSDESFLAWGWRIAFLFSGVLILVGLFVRLSVSETPAFQKVEQKSAKARMPLIDVIKRHPRGLLCSMGARIGVDVAFYAFALYITSYVTNNLDLPKQVALNAVLIGSALQLFLVPFFGALSDRYGRRPVYAAGAIAAGIWVFAFFAMLDTGSPAMILVAGIVGMATHAAMYGPQAAFIAELFSTKLRYSGASIGYQLSGVVGGGIALPIFLALTAAFGGVGVAVYVAATLVLALIALKAAPETAAVDLHDESPDQKVDPDTSARPAAAV